MTKKQEGNECPYCGGTGGYVVSNRISGYWGFNHNWDGYVDSSDTERIIYHKKPKTGRCMDCWKSVVYKKVKGD